MTRRGFTLIELLVVVAIIGILSSVVLVNLNNTRARARDAKRSADLKGIFTALDLYYDRHGHYPCIAWQSSPASGFLQALVDDDLISTNPKDPLNNGVGTGPYQYTYHSAKTMPGGQCGQIVHITYYIEHASSGCVEGLFIPPNHCHSFHPIPLPCTDPYATSPIDAWPSGHASCAGLAD